MLQVVLVILAVIHVSRLLNAGHEVFVIDNLCNGHEVALERVRSITNCELQFMNADIRDAKALDKIFKTFKPEAVIHFAGVEGCW